MSSKSERFSSKSSFVRWFPSNCVCGRGVQKFTSKTLENPGRPFFICVTKAGEHLFKWIEESVFEEVGDAKPKLKLLETEQGILKAENKKMKSEMSSLNSKIEDTKNEMEKKSNYVKRMFVGFIGMATLIVTRLVFLGNGNGNKRMLYEY